MARTLKIKHKMMFLNLILLSIFALTIFYFVFIKIFSSFDVIKNNTYTVFLNEKERNLTNMVSLAYGIIEDEYSNSKLTEEEKQANVQRLLSNLRYNEGTGYFFAYKLIGNEHAKFAFHSTQPELNNNNANLNGLDKNPDVSKRIMFRKELISKAKNGGGYVFYYYDKFDRKHSIIRKNALKISYALYFEPWDWVIVSGIYVDDVESRFQKINDFMSKQKDFTKVLTMAVTLFLIFVSYVFIDWSTRSIDFVIGKIKNRIERLHVGDLYSEEFLDDDTKCTELNEISKSLDNFVKTIKEELEKRNSYISDGCEEVLHAGSSGFNELSDVMHEMHEQYINSGLTDDHAEELEKNILALIKSERLYLDNDLILSEVALKLNSNPSYVSQVLNERLHISFRDLINQQRINEFKSRAYEIIDKKENILTLALDCGFRSKSNFNKTFKKHFGITPRDYINKLSKDRAINS